MDFCKLWMTGRCDDFWTRPVNVFEVSFPSKIFMIICAGEDFVMSNLMHDCIHSHLKRTSSCSELST